MEDTAAEATTTMTLDWHAEYGKAASLEGEAPADSASQASKAPEDPVLVFLDCLLAKEGGEWWASASQQRLKSASKEPKSYEVSTVDGDARKQLKVARRRLAVVANALVVELPALNASVNGKTVPRATKVRVLQLQLLCRMLRYGALLTKKRKDERKAAKKEIRGLMDRVALLLDAANPPSLADEDVDERTPFQEFLQREIAPRLCKLLPDLIRYLLVTYELQEAETTDARSKQNEGDSSRALQLRAVMKKAEAPAAPQPAEPVAKQSILSALQQERPAKRARLETSTPFKEMQFPHQLQLQRQQQHRHHRKSRRTSSSSNSKTSRKASSKNSSKTKSRGASESDLLRAAATEGRHPGRPGSSVSATATRSSAPSSSTARPASSTRKPGETQLPRRAARPSSTRLLGPGAGRSSFIAQPRVSATTAATPSLAGAKSMSKTQPQARASVAANPPARRAANVSVVMRTPDRPKRRGVRNAARVLVEASPPFRNTNVAGAARRPQPKPSMRTAKPPPLFR